MIVRHSLIVTSLTAVLTLCPVLASAQTVDHTDVPAMVGAINAERARFSLAPLAADPRLAAIAEAHSLEMARTRFFSHTSPSTGQPSDRVTHAGLHWSAVAENIAINQSPEAAQQALLHSPGHHDNMVDPVQRSVGVGIVRHGDQVWVTQLFATLNDAPGTAVTAPATIAAHPPAAVPAAIAAPTATTDDNDDDNDDNADDDRDAAAAAAPIAPPAPLAALTPMLAGLPVQGIPGLEQFLTGLGLSRQPSPRAASSAAATQVYTVQTPFGPVRVEVPSALASPAAAGPTAPRSARPARAPRTPRSHHPTPARGRVVEVDTLDV